MAADPLIDAVDAVDWRVVHFALALEAPGPLGGLWDAGAPRSSPPPDQGIQRADRRAEPVDQERQRPSHGFRNFPQLPTPHLAARLRRHRDLAATLDPTAPRPDHARTRGPLLTSAATRLSLVEIRPTRKGTYDASCGAAHDRLVPTVSGSYCGRGRATQRTAVASCSSRSVRCTRCRRPTSRASTPEGAASGRPTSR